MLRHMDRFRRLQAEQTSSSRSKSCERFIVNKLLSIRVLACLSIFFLWLWTATILWFTSRHNPSRSPEQLQLHLLSKATIPPTPLLPFKSFATRKKEWKKHTQELRSRRDSGETLNDEDAFNLEFSHLALTKSLLTGRHQTGHCGFSGPRPRHISAAAHKALVDEVAPKIRVTPEDLEGYLDRRSGQLLSMEHEFCTSEHAEVYGDGWLDEEYYISQETPVAYEFKGVCTTFNIDSVKRAQRAVVVFDNTNDHPQRCSPCPNPQMTKVWGGNGCGIMWLHQMNVKSFLDFNECYNANRDLIRKHGQRQEPGETPVKAAVFYPGTTLLVQFVQINPGHQLWDFLFSFFPLLINRGFRPPYYDHVVVQQASDCPDSIWSCRILRRLGVFKSKAKAITEGEENLVKSFDGVLPCFERLVAPVAGWNHLNEMYRPKALQLVRSKLQEAFQLTRLPKKTRTHSELQQLYKKVVNGGAGDLKLLLYPHSTSGEAGKRRAWLDVDEAHSELVKQGLQVDIVRDFAKVSVDEQARMFYEADILVMSHGGQMGNTIFSTRNTFIVEVNCGGYSHMAVGDDYVKGLNFLHVNYKPCGCPSRQQDSDNYKLPASELFNVLRGFVQDSTRFATGSRIMSCAQ